MRNPADIGMKVDYTTTGENLQSRGLGINITSVSVRLILQEFTLLPSLAFLNGIRIRTAHPLIAIYSSSGPTSEFGPKTRQFLWYSLVLKFFRLTYNKESDKYLIYHAFEYLILQIDLHIPTDFPYHKVKHNQFR